MIKKQKIKVQFLGASGTVTGSKYLIDTGDYKILVDCGLFQGLKELREKNWDFPPILPSDIDIILLTHGHLDHVGYLPKLVKHGYHKSVLGTKPTLEVAEVILRDSGKIQEEEAARANLEKYSKHHPALPLYTVKDAEKAIEHFKQIEEGTWIDLFPYIKVRFQYVGHIIGATYIELEVRGEIFVFSGDIGRENDLLMHLPKKPKIADYIFLESTYGDRIHPKYDVFEKIKTIVNQTVTNKGTLIIPSFAVERTQTLMLILWQLKTRGLIPDIPMIMDSPMGANILNIFKNNLEWHKLPLSDCEKMVKSFKIVQDYRETLEIIDKNTPKIVIAGSGMVTGGRVLLYLKYYINKPSTRVLLVGFQAEGTRGRALLEGSKSIKIFGEQYAVKAKVLFIDALSAHADSIEIIDWLNRLKHKPKKVFLVHGEPEASKALKKLIKETYQWDSIIPELYEVIEL
jgi:metallo-beta-lactamase family protein